MSLRPICAALLANRSQFFKLVEALEQATHSDIDDAEIEAVIDELFPEREDLTEQQAHTLVLMVCERKGKRA